MLPDALKPLLESLSRDGAVRVVGLKGGARGYAMASLSQATDRPLVCVTRDEEDADAWAADLAFFMGGAGTLDTPHVLRLPCDDAMPWDEVVLDNLSASERLATLFHLRHGTRARAVVLSARGLLRRYLPPALVHRLSMNVTVGEEHSRDALARTLVDLGYRAAPLVEDVGSFSMRGDILDVFPPLSENPVRLEFFGDTIESMRHFDAENQRTLAAVKTFRLFPARELFFSDSTRAAAEKAIRLAAEETQMPTSQVRERLNQVREGLSTVGLEGLWPGFHEEGLCTFFDYLPFWGKSPLWVLDGAAALGDMLADTQARIDKSHADAVERGDLCLPPARHFLRPTEVTPHLTSAPRVELGALPWTTSSLQGPLALSFGETTDLREAIRSHHGEDGALEPLHQRLTAWADSRTLVVIACGSRGQLDRTARLLRERELSIATDGGPLNLPLPEADVRVRAHLVVGDLTAGFTDSAGRLAVLSDEDLFGSRPKRRARRQRRSDVAFVSSLKDLKEGDVVVHADFGVARYAGLKAMAVQGVPGEFLVLEYAGKDKVYLPVGRMRLVSKFTGGDGAHVTLDRLGTDAWEKTRARVKENLLKMAAELLQLYAARRAHVGFRFSAPDRYFRQFESEFPFDETPDQQRAIDEVLADMQKPQAMDRLVCGDVGFGKTEVALRAAFKAVLDRKQVAVLVPTTLLAHQHFHTFEKRLAGYPVTVDVISGLRKPTEAREVVRKAAEGRVDILIGTHKLLGGDVDFKDLGLLIVDEEQRFGVKQKEQLKRLKAQVDVLTLSATPIPRTLNMAMAGLRDMSLIATPPTDRRSVRTFVHRFDTDVIREAVARELSRGGQVFFVHYRVQSLPALAQMVRALFPSINVAVAHGQMGEGQLEAAMLDFVEKRAQVLVCTSIVESGLDIPNANTLIVSRADTFGLAQLYQLRGRVGRSKERAYAHFLVPARRPITKDAERRLEVLQAFTDLGAGFTIASHDLEIRGAGNLLGGQQSGAIEAVGFDLYTQLLEESIAEMRGEPPRTQVEPDVNVPLPALLPDTYVPDVAQRLNLYKRFAQVSTPEELDALRAEVVDRFGDCPDEVDHLCRISLLKMDMRALNLRSLDVGPDRMVVTLGPHARLNGDKLAKLIARAAGVYRLSPDLKLVCTTKASAGRRDFMSEAQKVLRDLFSVRAT